MTTLLQRMHSAPITLKDKATTIRLQYLPPAKKLGQGYLFTGMCDSVHRGVSASVHAGITAPLEHIPLLPDQVPPWDQVHPPGTRYTPQYFCSFFLTSLFFAFFAFFLQFFPFFFSFFSKFFINYFIICSHTPPGAVHAGRYRQQAGGMHPTGMHSCFVICFKTYCTRTISVGCVPSAAVTIVEGGMWGVPAQGVYLPCWGYLPRGVPIWGLYLHRGCSCPGRYLHGVYLPGGVLAWGMYLPGEWTCLGGVPA